MLGIFKATPEAMNRITSYIGHWRMSVHSSLREEELIAQLLSPTTIIANLDVGDGIVILENLRGGYDGKTATISFLFWDRVIRSKVGIMRAAVEEAASIFDIGRFTALLPINNLVASICYQKVGFKREGRMRRFLIDGQDCVILGLLRSDLAKQETADAKQSVAIVEGTEASAEDSPNSVGGIREAASTETSESEQAGLR